MSPHTKNFILNSTLSNKITVQSNLEMPLVNLSYKTSFKPTNSVFAFDLHGVVFYPSLITITKVLLQSPKKWCLISAFLNPRTIYRILEAVFTKKVIEQFIEEIAIKNPSLTTIKPLLLDMANAQKEHKAVVALIKMLKNKGYPIIAFSNIGEQSILILQKKFPDTFALFDHIINATSQDGYISKPSLAAFQKLTAVIPKNKKIIFVDDTAENIIQAHAHGIYVLPFFNATSLERMLLECHII
jgi:FMN phosphatase YigB (HAD superfamily)